MTVIRHSSRPNLTTLLSLAIAAVSLTALGLVLLDRGHPQAPVAEASPAGTAGPAATVAAALAQLKIPTRTIELTSEKALRVRKAIKQGDEATAQALSAAVLAQSQLQDWRFEPFTSFVARIADVADPNFEAQLTDWVTHHDKDALPLVVRARYYRDRAWSERGDAYAARTQPAHLAAFHDDMAKALADIDAAIRLDGGNPYSYYLQLDILHGSGLSPDMAAAFQAAVAKYPGYYPLYDMMLATLEPRWGGTVKAMSGFVDHAAGSVADNSPLKLLYLDLYRSLLITASNDCAEQQDSAQCVSDTLARTVTPALQEQVKVALRLYDQRDKYQFGLAVEDILSEMLEYHAADAAAGTLLDLAADSMHSNTQLVPDKPVENDYMVDKLVAQSWYWKGFYDNALTKNAAALKAIDRTAFPDEEARDLARADIYRQIAKVQERQHDYVAMTAAEQASLALGGINDFTHAICYGYDQMKAYAEAIDACTLALEGSPGNTKARFWRGTVYDAMGNGDAALTDFTAVAQSEDNFRANAVIAMSMIHFNRKDLKGALDVLNAYPYLYNPDLTKRDSVAVGYNNRCYAYMELGQLDKALADCRQSLQYGSIPDAIRKERELEKRLGLTPDPAGGTQTP